MLCSIAIFNLIGLVLEIQKIVRVSNSRASKSDTALQELNSRTSIEAWLIAELCYFGAMQR